MPVLTIHPTKIWFDNLRKIQGRMQNINHNTNEELKAFSKQKLGDLLNNDIDKGNLSQFCQTESIGIVFDETINDAAKIFFEFLNDVSFSVESSLRNLWYSIATDFNPLLLNNTVSQVMRMTLGEVFDKDDAKLELHAKMIMFVPSEFYSRDGQQIADGTAKLGATIKKILS